MMMSSIVKKLLFCGAKGFPSISDSDDSRVVPVPQAGHVRVYVGRDINMMCKFEIEANYLNHPLFRSLLQLSAEQEFGYSYDGALRIACDIDLFHYILHLLDTSNPSAHYMELSDLISKFYSTSATVTTLAKTA
ncbi:protein SMALL AUXIN UP-REGULATED RNA 12-like [Rosa rugosa]|uniref:protein SMALL AUXIN UP-REGULATED RNA 12-like n=1 Tax=Rosa rugosa TaxID=74645 RepID=UPI002B41214C|nr:protein SMALL AUXIN UP-REGULATED RNA 12-like [Rosa rugosa]